MAYFDIVNGAADENEATNFAKLFGYKKIFTLGKEVFILDCKDVNPSDKKVIIRNNANTGMLVKCLRMQNVIGILTDSAPSGNVLESIKQNNKIIILNSSELTCVDKRQRISNLFRFKRIVSSGMHKKTEIAIATFANDKEQMLSSMQLVEIAKFIGADGDTARKMVSKFGDVL